MGAPAKPWRRALAALIIKEKLGVSDRETVEQIKENPYLQYFMGQNSYQKEAPFDPSMMVHFRQRISQTLLQKINRRIVQKSLGFNPEEPRTKKLEEAERPKENRGQLLIDATVSPADIKYPTYVDLLNQARKTTESIIAILDKSLKGKLEKNPEPTEKRLEKITLNLPKRGSHLENKGEMPLKNNCNISNVTWDI
jgi:IS5 family transposase